jgi:hypothetical protein
MLAFPDLVSRGRATLPEMAFASHLLRGAAALPTLTMSAMVVVVASGCGRPPAAHVTNADRARASHSSAPDAAVVGHPRWVPRVAPAPFPGFGAIDASADIYAPIRNNYGTDATVYLGQWRVGVIDENRRYLYQDGRLRAVNREPTSEGVASVLAIAPGQGGGFLFAGPAGLFFAATFEGPLRKLASDARWYSGMAPGSILLGGEQPGFVSTGDGLPIAGSPQAENVFAHRNGFAIAWSEVSNQAWFTANGRDWKTLASQRIRDVFEDGDALLVSTEGDGLRVGSDGSSKSVTLTADEWIAKKWASNTPLIPDHSGPGDAYEGALIDAGWARTGRGDDEWVGVYRDQLWLAQGRGRGLHSLGSVPRDEGCGVAPIFGQMLLLCFQLGTRLSVSRVDVSTGRVSLERTIQIRRGVAQHLGTTDTFPTTLMATSSCDGDAEAGLCVRNREGVWTDYPPFPKVGRLLVFPNGLVTFGGSDVEGWRVQASGKPTRVFPAGETRPLLAAMGITGKDSSQMRTVLSGALRTATGIRLFHTPNPMLPVSGDGDSYALDLPFDSARPPSIEHVPGVVACAGMHGLRLAGGRLWETNDAWHSWRPVEPPPTGRVPRDLAAAMCFDSGCVLGVWARIGWN